MMKSLNLQKDEENIIPSLENLLLSDENYILIENSSDKKHAKKVKKNEMNTVQVID
jgi:hypothetical protein